MRPKGHKIVEFVRLVENAKSLADTIYRATKKKARLPPREPGTARENDACS